MDYESIANAFYGTPVTPPDAPDSLLGSGKAPEPVSQAPDGHIDETSSTESIADAFYGIDRKSVV